MHVPTTVLATFFAAGQLLSFVQAHVEMKNPIPFRSKFLIPNGPNTDFSMTSPLNPDGSNFPCKGYQNDDLPPTATLTAGGSFTLELDGSATHNGGSCQLSLSYDGGKNWVVIYSIVGGCPSDTETYTVPIPSDVPSSDKALLAWSWENHTGNREFYMNCAPVEVVGTSASFTGPRMHEANIFGGTCITVEGFDVVYPNPGKFIHFGGAFVGGNTGPPTVLTPCNFDENQNLTVTGSGSVSGGSADPPAAPSNSSATATTNSTSAASGLSTSTTIVTETGTTTVTVAADPPAATATVTASGNSTAGAADSPAATGAPAAPSNSTATAGAPCSPDGSIVCASDGQDWFMCNQGALVDMGSVAAGTTCSNGQITRKRALPPQLRRDPKFGAIYHRFI